MSLIHLILVIAIACAARWVWQAIDRKHRARRAKRDLSAELDRMEQEFKQHILNVRSQLMDARQKLAVAIADEKRLKHRMEQEEAKAQSWHAKAQEVEDLSEARHARDQAAQLEQRAADTRRLWNEQTHTLHLMRQRLGELATKVEDLKKRRHQVQVEAARVSLGETLDRLDGDASFKAMEDLIQEMEDLVH
ncbi:MAG: PspA/IM30 family protein [Myxococcota bacterium]